MSLVGLREFGLLEHKSACFCATSPDAIALVKTGDGVTPYVVEIKTKTNDETKGKARATARKYGEVQLITIGDLIEHNERFAAVVDKADYRVQALQHAAATGIHRVLFVVASPNKIIFVLLIDFEMRLINAHRSLMSYIGER